MASDGEERSVEISHLCREELESDGA